MMNQELQLKLVSNLELVFKSRKELFRHANLADELAELLGCTRHSIYRRFRGEVAFSMDELFLVCRHFDISADALFGHLQNSVSFSIKKPDFLKAPEQDPFRVYLQDTLDTISVLRGLGNLKMYIPGDDIFALLIFGSPTLTGFKLFYWFRSLLGYKPFQNRPFDRSILELPFKSELGSVYDAYCELSTIEIWNNDTLSKVMQQIVYYHDAQIITDRALLKEMFDELLEMIEKVRDFAKRGTKLGKHGEGAYQLYYSEILSDNNGHLIMSDELNAVALSHNIFNSLITYDERYINETRLWTERMIQQSTLISSASERERNRLFKQLTDKVRGEMKRLGVE